jgi:hypothetical protein
LVAATHLIVAAQRNHSLFLLVERKEALEAEVLALTAE